MKIVEETPTLIKLQKSKFSLVCHYINLFCRIISGNFFALLGLVAIYSGSPRTLKCKRVEPTQVNCNLISHTFLGEENTSIRQLEGALVETEADDDGDTYKVILFTKKDSFYLNDSGLSNESEVRQEANRINTFINDPQQKSLIIKYGHDWILYGIGGLIIFGFSALVIYHLKQKVTTICILDKQSGRMYLKRRGIIGVETIDCPLDKIDRARFEETDSENNRYDAELVLISGRKIRLNLQKKSQYNSKKVATSINQFLNRCNDTDDLILIRHKIHRLKQQSSE